MSHLILLRHGHSEWNEKNLFTGWFDCDLTDAGRAEAAAAGPAISAAGLAPTIIHTSLQRRAIRTAQIVAEGLDRMWLPVRRSWRLNERHYGDLTGRDKAETAARYGEEMVKVWRRSYDTPPPPITDDNPSNPNQDAAYGSLPPELVPLSECLADVVARALPWWYDAIVADLAAGHTVLVVAHGNSLRALVKHIDGVSDDAISELNIPTGVPLHYELDASYRPIAPRPILERYLGDPEAIAAKAAAVAAQGSVKK